jgi:hypothetical protein
MIGTSLSLVIQNSRASFPANLQNMDFLFDTRD